MNFKNALLAAPVVAMLGVFSAGAAQADTFTFMTTSDGTPYMMETTPVFVRRSVVTTSPSIMTPTVISHPVTFTSPSSTVIDSRPVVIRERRNDGLIHLGLPLVDLDLF